MVPHSNDMKNYADLGGAKVDNSRIPPSSICIIYSNQLFIYIHAIKTNQRITPRINSRRETFTKMTIQFCFVFFSLTSSVEQMKEAHFKTERQPTNEKKVIKIYIMYSSHFQIALRNRLIS